MSDSSKFSGITTKLGLSPLEVPQVVHSKTGGLTIGIPKERTFQEHRVSLTPSDVRILTANGHKVIIETGAGKASFYKDQEYADSGAIISYDTKEVFKAETILKVAPPTLEEIGMLQTEQILFSPIHLPTLRKECIS